MRIEGSIALVTGANRGLGAAFARGLLAAGAAKVYAAARDPAAVSLPGVVPVRLDVTRPERLAELARELTDVTLLVNNAGIAEFGPLLAPGAIDAGTARPRPPGGRSATTRSVRRGLASDPPVYLGGPSA